MFARKVTFKFASKLDLYNVCWSHAAVASAFMLFHQEFEKLEYVAGEEWRNRNDDAKLYLAQLFGSPLAALSPQFSGQRGALVCGCTSQSQPVLSNEMIHYLLIISLSNLISGNINANLAEFSSLRSKPQRLGMLTYIKKGCFCFVISILIQIYVPTKCDVFILEQTSFIGQSSMFGLELS